MKHYDDTEWIFYKERVFSKAKLEEMEEHLYKCDVCMDIFLSLIDIKQEKEAEKVININFTDNIMDNIQKIEYTPIIRKEENIKFKDMFIYYVAVASVAIVLTMGGFYKGMVDIVSQRTVSSIEISKFNLPNTIFNRTQKIVKNTSDFINNFEIYNCKEEAE